MKLWYAGYNRYGINFTFDSDGWKVYAFKTKKQRDMWVDDNSYNSFLGHYVACKLPRQDVDKIMPCGKHCRRLVDWDGHYLNDSNLVYKVSM